MQQKEAADCGLFDQHMATAAAAGPQPVVHMDLLLRMPRELEQEFRSSPEQQRFWRQADMFGLAFWSLSNFTQSLIFRRHAQQLTQLNMMLKWHTRCLAVLALVQLLVVLRAPAWYSSRRHTVMMANRLSRSVTQIFGYLCLVPADILVLSGVSATNDSQQKAVVHLFSLFVLVPLTQLQQAVFCLLPLSVMLPMQLAWTAIYIMIYLPMQAAAIALAPEAIGALSQGVCAAAAKFFEPLVMLLAGLPGMMSNNVCVTQEQSVMIMLVFLLLLNLLFVPVLLVIFIELKQREQFLAASGRQAACPWRRCMLKGVPGGRLLLGVAVLLLPWQLAVAGAQLWEWVRGRQ